ncbi:MAG: hypothetical protein OXE75_09150 [bacterium]|nr:hypothetical protein [bacterium]
MRRHHGSAGFGQIAGVERDAQEVLGILARWDPPIDVDAAATHPRRRANQGFGGDV